MYRNNSATVKKVKKEINKGRLEKAFRNLYNQKDKSESIDIVYREAQNVLNSLTFDMRADLMNRKDIKKQPHFKHQEDKMTITLEEMPRKHFKQHGLPKTVLQRGEPITTTPLTEMFTEEEYIQESIHGFIRRVGYVLSTYISFFQKLKHEYNQKTSRRR